MDIRERLRELVDEEYRKKVISDTGLPEQYVLGVKLPEIRALAKEICDSEPVMRVLPPETLEEEMLCGAIVSRTDDFKKAVVRLDRLLPYLSCTLSSDSLSPAVFNRYREALVPALRRWLTLKNPFAVRFAIRAMTRLYNGDYYEPSHLYWVMEALSDSPAVYEMAAHYYSVILATHPGTVLKLLESFSLPPEVQALTIKKAGQSTAVSKDIKLRARVYKPRVL